MREALLLLAVVSLVVGIGLLIYGEPILGLAAFFASKVWLSIGDLVAPQSK